MKNELRIKEGYLQAEKYKLLDKVEKYGLLLWKKREFNKANAPILTLEKVWFHEHKSPPTVIAILLQGEVQIDGAVYQIGETIPFISSADLNYLQVPKNKDNYIRAEFLEETPLHELREELDKNPELKTKIQKMWLDL